MNLALGTNKAQGAARPDHYKWVVLSNTTLGVLMATIDLSIMLIALPDIFRGIGIDPLAPGNSFYLLWMILGFMIMTSVLVVSLGRLGDMYGRVRIYNLGFAVYTFFSLLLTITWMSGTAAALWAGHHAALPGGGLGHADRQFRRHHHGRIPRGRARNGARHQSSGRHQWLVSRTRPRWRARSDPVAAHLLGIGADRLVRHLVGLPQPSGGTTAHHRPPRLAGERHLRRGPRGDHGRDHLRYPALRWFHHGVDEPVRARMPYRWRGPAGRVCPH